MSIKLKQAAQQALNALDEATTYTGSPSWSPSMTDECIAAASALRASLAQQPATPDPVVPDSSEHLRVIASLGAALRRLSFAAQTTGGTDGPDAELQSTIGQAEQALSLGGIWQAMSATGEPVAWSEREQLRHAQAAVVMPMIGPLLDAWENADREVMSQEPELSKQLKNINSAMEDADTYPAPSVPATAEPVAWLDEMLADTREVFDANGSETPQAVRDVIEYVASWVTVYREKNHPAPSVPDGLQWFTVAEHGLPEVGEVVVGGLWYTDPWLKPECATSFMWGQCRVVDTKHRDFKDGKQWLTFGPSHNQITHWARLNPPSMLAANTHPAPSVPNDHQIAALVNKVRDIARTFHDHQSLRERIAIELVPALKVTQEVKSNAERWRYAIADGGNQSMNFMDIFDDWDGDGDFVEVFDDAMLAAKKASA